MLLTSNGLRNEALRSALADLMGKPFGSARVVFVPTASVATSGDHGWLLEDLSRLHGLGWRELNVLELNGLPGPLVLERLRRADVIYCEGGNHYHLANSITGGGLAAEMAGLLESKVYVGVSAGSMIFSRNLSAATGEVVRRAGGPADPRRDGRALAVRAVRLVPQAAPELARLPQPDAPWFEKAAARLDFPVYAIDDDSAVRVRGDETDVVSSGEWRLLNAPAGDAGGSGQARGSRPGKPPGMSVLSLSRLALSRLAR